MGERKVLNKYYPPDFDPAKLPRGKRQQNNEMKVRMMLPMSVRCKTCGTFMYKGTKFNTRKEDIEGEDYLGIRIFRFYYRCTNCAAEFCMKTDPKTSDYILEQGASRNYEPWREADVLKAEAVLPREEEERRNAMKALENRTKDSKREMDIMEALDEMKSLKARHAGITAEDALRALQQAGAAAADGDDVDGGDEQAAAAAAGGAGSLPEEDEAALQQFLQQQHSIIRRLDSDDGTSGDDDDAVVKRRKLQVEDGHTAVRGDRAGATAVAAAAATAASCADTSTAAVSGSREEASETVGRSIGSDTALRAPAKAAAAQPQQQPSVRVAVRAKRPAPNSAAASDGGLGSHQQQQAHQANSSSAAVGLEGLIGGYGSSGSDDS